MIKQVEFILSPEQLFAPDYIKKAIAQKFEIDIKTINEYRLLRKSIDARKSVKYNVAIEFSSGRDKLECNKPKFIFQAVSNSPEVIIVGAGPAGYFAAVNCLLKGLKPIVIERGNPIETRQEDINTINIGKDLNLESNYAFGEGGAGAYSDGKLYTRSTKRGNVPEILSLFHYFGANEDILYESHPHIGTDKLPDIMRNIRNKIIECGGEVHFNKKVDDIIVKNGVANGVVCSNGEIFEAKFVVLATGHSARDVYSFLKNKEVCLEAKGFAMGVRVEHPQALIDSIRYRRKERGEFLPAASYSIAKQVDGRGVYSFCMCPGGHIINSSTERNQIVVNGMSNSKRNSPFANSGIVVELRPEDFGLYSEIPEFSGLEFQKQLERMSFQNSASGLMAPAQRLGDFVKGTISTSLPESSYQPGFVNSPMHFWLPEIISDRLRKAFKLFNKSMSGFLTNDAIVVGVESRTSSPIKILRDKENLVSVNIEGLYPCGEGAGYAGGIASSAVDGMQVINKIAQLF